MQRSEKMELKRLFTQLTGNLNSGNANIELHVKGDFIDIRYQGDDPDLAIEFNFGEFSDRLLANRRNWAGLNKFAILKDSALDNIPQHERCEFTLHTKPSNKGDEWHDKSVVINLNHVHKRRLATVSKMDLAKEFD
ncbi:MAG: hypothetical protein IT558_04530 [Alphaproteobacteria bacterium]|nr:hypothetical protein [Alphaproteobacteria bacterium]